MREYLDAYTDYDDAARQFGDEVDEYPEEIRPKRPRQPNSLSLYLQCKKFHCLLFEGGLLDQPIELWQPVTVAGEVYETWLQEHQQEQQAGAINDAQLRSFGMGR